MSLTVKELLKMLEELNGDKQIFIGSTKAELIKVEVPFGAEYLIFGSHKPLVLESMVEAAFYDGMSYEE